MILGLRMKMSRFSTLFLCSLFCGLFGFWFSHFIYHIELTAYEQEVSRQEQVIKVQHGKLSMLDGILRNEIKQFTLEWVDLSQPQVRLLYESPLP